MPGSQYKTFECAYCGETLYHRPRAAVFHKGKSDEKALCIECDAKGVKINMLTGRFKFDAVSVERAGGDSITQGGEFMDRSRAHVPVKKYQPRGPR